MADLSARKYNSVQLWGLPYRVTEKEVADWLREAADPISVTIIMEDGRSTGIADCVFSSATVAKRVAQTMHKKDMGHRYIECFYGERRGGHKLKLSARSKRTQDQPASIQGPDKADTPSSSGLLQDCYFYQIEECKKKSKCPFLHRTIPEEVCKLSLFKQCKSNIKCPKQHLSPACLQAPSKEEEARLRCVRKGRWKECLDCEVASTSSFLLENHLNSEEHYIRIKQIKMEGKVIKGVVGNKPDNWSLKDERDFIAARKEKKAQTQSNITANKEKKASTLSKDHIHIRYIPLEITMKTFRQICLQFGELSSLKMLPMLEADAQHAYVRYTTEEDKEFAFIKLKELQKLNFDGISLLRHQRPTNNVTNASADDVEDDAKNVNREEMSEDLLHQKIRKISEQLLKVTSAKEEEESKLLFCRTQKKICQLNGAGPEETMILKLIKEEHQIQMNLRDFECAVEQAEEDLDKLKCSSTSGSRSLDSSSFLKLKSERSPDNHYDFKIRKGEDCSVRTFFLPDDVFNSDDEDDVDVIKEETSGLKSGIQNMMSPQLTEEKQGVSDNLFLGMPNENNTLYSDDLIGQTKTVCEDVIESSKPVVRNRNVNK